MFDTFSSGLNILLHFANDYLHITSIIGLVHK
jgi:hypothetical protein